MSDVTRILDRVQHGDPKAAEELLPLVYDELRKLAAHKMANEAPGQTLQPTALVHEAWFRLGGDDQPAWQNRGHFLAAAAEAMRRILVESARRKLRLKRGGGGERVELHDSAIEAPAGDEKILHMNRSSIRYSRARPRIRPCPKGSSPRTRDEDELAWQVSWPRLRISAAPSGS